MVLITIADNSWEEKNTNANQKKVKVVICERDRKGKHPGVFQGVDPLKNQREWGEG